MAIRHKRKNSTGYTWLSTDLVDGQIGINTADGTLHVKKSDDSVATIPNDSALAGKADAVNPSLSGTLTLANGTTISGSFSSPTDSPYIRSSSGNDTYLRVLANGSTETSVAGQLLYGANDISNCVQVLLRARGNTSTTASSGILWQKVTGGVVGIPPEFSFVSHNGTSYVVPYAMTPDGSVTNDNHIANKKYVDDAVAGASGLPSQTGNSGKFLTTDGTNASWATVSGGAAALDDLTDVVITTPSNGQVLSYNGTNWVNAAASGGGGTASIAEFDFPAAINGANNFLAAPSLFSSFVASWQARNNSTAATQLGWNAATIVGSASSQSRTTNSVSAAGERLFRIRYSSATTANSGCGIHWSNVNHGIQQSHFLPYGDIFAFFRFNIFDERTDARHAVGWHRGILGANDPSTDPGTLPMIILGADSADTNMQIMHAASSASPTKIDLGADFPKYGTHQAYEFAFYFPARAGYANTLHYYVKNLNNGEVATGTLTSNIPTPTPSYMNIIMAMRATSSANMVSIEPSIVYLQTNVMG